MMPFRPIPAKQPNFFQHLFNLQPKENVIIEVNNLLAKAENISDIETDQIIGIADGYKINLEKQFTEERKDMFRKLVRHVINDDNISNEEAMQLNHLRDLLFLKQQDVEKILKEETQRRYGEHIDEALQDNRVSKAEKERLEQLRKNLMIDEAVAKQLYAGRAKANLQKFIEDAVSDERLSPDEEKEMNEIAKSLGIELSFDDNSQKALERFRLYWQIENGDLPELKSDINLFKGEKLHFKTAADWVEHKQVTRRINYGGPTARIRLAKGIYYKAGSMGVNRTTEDVWQRLDSGMIYLTDRRIIFMGSRGNKNIRLNKILTFEPYNNGVDIQKSAGKSPFLEFSDNVDIFSMILGRLLFVE